MNQVCHPYSSESTLEFEEQAAGFGESMKVYRTPSWFRGKRRQKEVLVKAQTSKRKAPKSRRKK